MAADHTARRLALEALAIVASILAAFGIDAWWDGRQDRLQERESLAALLDEMTTNQERLAQKREWQMGIEDATNALLAVSAPASPVLGADSLDHLLADASWWGGSTHFEMSVVDALVSGGGLAGLRDAELRRALTDWRRRVEVLELNERQDYDAFFGVWMPFLREHADLPQITNAMTHVPGDEQVPNFGDRVPTAASTDHSALLRSREFRNVLLQRKWVHDDVLNQYDQVEPALDQLVQMLRADLEITAP